MFWVNWCASERVRECDWVRDVRSCTTAFWWVIICALQYAVIERAECGKTTNHPPTNIMRLGRLVPQRDSPS